MKILAFPYAGGNKYSYNFLKPYFNENIDIKVFEYAGRGNRISERPLDTIDAIIDDLWQNILKFIKKEEPYIIYGHSMGALIAFLICHKIQGNRLKTPLKLIVSGRKGPQTAKEKKIWDYPSNLFWKELINLGGIPKEMEDEISLRNFFEPIIKADFKAIEEFSFKKSYPLDIPIDVIYGDEELEKEKDFLSWDQETSNKVTYHTYKGNHFFIHSYAKDIANHLIRGFQNK